MRGKEVYKRKRGKKGNKNKGHGGTVGQPPVEGPGADFQRMLERDEKREVGGAGEGLGGVRGEGLAGKSGTCGLGGTLEGLVRTSRRDSGGKEGVLTRSSGSGGSPAGGTRSGGESAESTGVAADGEAVRSDE